jgi:inosine/xanthosine triphosphate pyrophosphatase family protein
MVCYNFFMKILIATKNRGKFNEIAGVLRDVSLKDG